MRHGKLRHYFSKTSSLARLLASGKPVREDHIGPLATCRGQESLGIAMKRAFRF
jgi:hypothetical protein